MAKRKSERKDDEHRNALEMLMSEAATKDATNKKARRIKKPLDLSKFKDIPERSDEGAPKTFKIVAWNVNGLRALLKKEDDFEAYVTKEDPDIMCISETKLAEDVVGTLEPMLEDFPYQYWSCAVKKGYSGVAVFSKVKPLQIRKGFSFSNGKEDDEGRCIALEYEGFWVVHTYVPNAGMKLDRLDYRTENWDTSMRAMLKELEKTKPVIWCGDLNVAHQEVDIHDPVKNRNKSPGFTDAERENFGKVLDQGFVDVYRHMNPKQQQFTYWSYRFGAKATNKGWRLDYFVVSSSLLKNVEDCFVRSKIEGSDHCPIGLLIKS